VPAAVIPEIARFELPVFVTVNPCAAELPSVTLPKLRLPGFTLIVYDAATPVALSATVAGELGALLIIETAPRTLPVDCGVYCTLKFPLWPGVNVIGSAKPLKLKPAPVTVACETVKFAVPLFLSCTVCEFAFPVTTEPKLALAGVRLNPACTCVPVTAATAFTPSLFVTVTLPLVVPPVVGANFTANVTLCEGASVSGVTIPLTEIPVPLAATCVTVTLEFPLFESCTFWMVLLPAFTLPKFTLVGERDIV
jgi:hypothetical protein